MKILAIEDDASTVKSLQFYLQMRYPDVDVITASNGLEGLKLVDDESPDLVLIDSSLPDIDHLELVKQIRVFSEIPLLVLSDSETDLDRARGLEIGADDCINKPLNPIDLLARVKALLRRAYGFNNGSDQIVSIDNELRINVSTREVFLSGNRVYLTPIEYKLLLELTRSDGKILTHRLILDKVWGTQYAADESFVKKYIYRLRRKLGSNSLRNILVTERGIGYRLNKIKNNR
ncbi:MAG: response regulator transcription factor [Dehalococcoidales bacterium]|nr:response regulator transcription factor [Dehalococcoidales bacterium]